MPVVITVLNSYSVIKISCNSLYIRSGHAHVITVLNSYSVIKISCNSLYIQEQTCQLSSQF